MENSMIKKLVLIGGMPRSGTTLAETIIGSHSKISIPPGDFPFVQEYALGLSVKEILERLGERGTWKLWHEKDFADLFGQEHGKAFREILVRYAKSIQKEIPGAKAPYFEFYYETLNKWLNGFDLKFIHIVRNPFDYMASLRHSHLHGYQRNKTFNEIPVHARNWHRSVAMGLARSLFDPSNYFLLKYEDLATFPQETTHALCTFLGLAYEEERMLDRKDYSYHNTNTSFPDYPINSRKHYLNKSEIQIISSICGELGRVVGYEDEDMRTLPHESPPKPNIVLRGKRKLSRIFKKIVKKTTNRDKLLW